jgi:flavocytochrome c
MKRRFLYRCFSSFILANCVGCTASGKPDVIVIGGGAAGLAAAVSAAENGASVLLLEKEPSVGGNSSLSTGFFAAVDPDSLKKYGVKDSIDLYIEQMLESGHGLNDPQLVKVLARNAFSTLKWLEKQGMEFQDKVTSSQGSGWIRDHRPIPANGESYVTALLKSALKLDVKVLTNHRVIDLNPDQKGRFNVVTVRNMATGEIGAFEAKKSVIVASGGFGANLEMIGRYNERLKGLNTHNWPGNTGDLLGILVKCGAELRDLDKIQCLPGNPPGRQRRVRLHTDQDWFILVDEEGKRFVREDAPRNELCDAILSLPRRFGYTVIDNKGLMAHDLLIQKEVVLGIESGDAWKADSIEQMADYFSVPREALAATVSDYNLGVERQKDRLGRDPMYLKHKIDTPPYWGCYAGVSVHSTMGGVRIDAEARCVDANNQPIPNIFACGEVTSGVHGANRLGGHGLPDAIVFGRIAGRNSVNI